MNYFFRFCQTCAKRRRVTTSENVTRKTPLSAEIAKRRINQNQGFKFWGTAAPSFPPPLRLSWTKQPSFCLKTSTSFSTTSMKDFTAPSTRSSQRRNVPSSWPAQTQTSWNPGNIWVGIQSLFQRDLKKLKISCSKEFIKGLVMGKSGICICKIINDW